MAAAPDGDPRATMNLEHSVPPDDRGVLVDPDHCGATGCLERDQGGQRFRPGVVMGYDCDTRDEPERLPPAQRPEDRTPTKSEVELALGENHRAGRAADDDRSPSVGIDHRPPERRFLED